jgi:hypothetical protein
MIETMLAFCMDLLYGVNKSAWLRMKTKQLVEDDRAFNLHQASLQSADRLGSMYNIQQP